MQRIAWTIFWGMFLFLTNCNKLGVNSRSSPQASDAEEQSGPVGEGVDKEIDALEGNRLSEQCSQSSCPAGKKCCDLCAQYETIEASKRNGHFEDYCLKCKHEGAGVYWNNGGCSLVSGWFLETADDGSCKPVCEPTCNKPQCGGACLPIKVKYRIWGWGSAWSFENPPAEHCGAGAPTGNQYWAWCSYNQEVASGETEGKVKCLRDWRASDNTVLWEWECQEKDVHCKTTDYKYRINSKCKMDEPK
jgi:hypothetical protein